jgi:dihydrofolate reductase
MKIDPPFGHRSTHEIGGTTMRKLKLAMYVSLDGVVEEPSWTGPFWNDELSDMQAEYLYSSDALVLGRVTYEGFAAAWPGMEEATGDFGRKMNSMPKHVASRTLTEAEWNASIIEGDLGEAIAELKEGDGGDLLIYGSGTLVDELTRLGLIDEYRLMIHPVLVGKGKRLFDSSPERALRLADVKTTGTGVVVLSYI